MFNINVMKWIDVKNKLPEIPKGKHSVSVIVATFDSYYEELNPGKGYDIQEAMFGPCPKSSLFPDIKENIFMELYLGEKDFWGPTGDPVTHWMYMPKHPTYKIKRKSK
jgi:hypothetical protein